MRRVQQEMIYIRKKLQHEISATQKRWNMKRVHKRYNIKTIPHEKGVT